MKNIFSIILFFVCLKSFGQNGYPIPQKLGSDSTLIWIGANFNGGVKGKLINNPYTDTTAANIQNPKIYPGAQIFTTSDNKFWVRNSTANRWLDISGGGGGGTVTAANNGLSLSGTTVVLGGSTIGQYSAIQLVTNPLTFYQNNIRPSTQSDSNMIRLGNFQTPTGATDSMLTSGILFDVGSKPLLAAAQRVRFRIEAMGASGSTTGTGYLRIMSSANGAAYQTIFLVNSTPVNSSTSGLIPLKLNIGGQPIGATGSNFIWGSSALAALTSGTPNIAIGQNSMLTNSTGNSNVAIGASALSLGNSDFNTAVGHFALRLTTTGDQNTAMGYNALGANIGGIKNSGFGVGVFENNTSGSFLSAFGHDAGLHNTTGSNSAYLGWLAGSLNDIGSNNVAIGWSSSRTVQFMNKSVFIGESSGYLTATGLTLQKDSCYNCIAIGSNSYATLNNQMRLGNDSITSAFIYGITHNNTAALNVVMQDSTNKQIYHIPVSQLTVTTPTWQQTLVAGSTLNQDNTVTNAANTLTFTNNTLGADYGVRVTSTSTAASAGAQILFNVDLSGANTNTTEVTVAALFSNSHTGSGINYAVQGTASGNTTNYGGYFGAVGGTNNIAIAVPASSGNVGIGTSTPVSVAKLHVIADAGNFAIEGIGTSGGIGVYGETTNGSGISGVATTSGGVAVKGESTGANTNNIAAQFTATTGTNNYAILVPVSSGKIGFGTAAPTAGILHIVVPTTTGTTTTSGIIIDANALTSGTSEHHSSSSITSGNLINLVTTGTVAAAGNEALNIDRSGANGTNAITVTGARISVTNTNGTSGTNTAIDLTASGATTDNIAMSAAGAIRQTYAGTTQTTTSSGFTIAANSLTSGTAMYMASSSLTSGNLLQLVGTSTTLAAGNEGLDIAISGANGTNAITATGLRSTVTNTNGTSGTNIAAQLNASGATTANWALFTGSATGADGRININNAANIANQVALFKSLTNTGADGIVVLANNETAKLTIGYNTITASGGLIVTTTATGTQFSAGISAGGFGTPTSTVTTGGSFGTAYIAKTANYTATATDFTIEVTANSPTITLPTAVGITGRIYYIVNSGAGTVTIATTSSQTFVNVTATPTTLSMATVGATGVQSNGSNWLRLSSL